VYGYKMTLTMASEVVEVPPRQVESKVEDPEDLYAPAAVDDAARCLYTEARHDIIIGFPTCPSMASNRHPYTKDLFNNGCLPLALNLGLQCVYFRSVEDFQIRCRQVELLRRGGKGVRSQLRHQTRLEFSEEGGLVPDGVCLVPTLIEKQAIGCTQLGVGTVREEAKCRLRGIGLQLAEEWATADLASIKHAGGERVLAQLLSSLSKNVVLLQIQYQELGDHSLRSHCVILSRSAEVTAPFPWMLHDARARNTAK
jgi:hypothetical protein